MRTLIQRSRMARGQALVEFALALIPMLLVIFGTFDGGRAVFDYNSLAESARQANRLAIVDQDTTAIKDRAIEYASSLGLSTSNVTVCFKTATTTQRDCSKPSQDDCSSNLQIGCLAIVTSTTAFKPVTPLISSIFSSISMSSTSIGTIEYVCPTATKVTCP
jgi:Flp pilus assembly protein TadG